MKKYQFEEITAALSIIITLLAYKFEIDWLFYIYFVKSCLDTVSALKAAYQSAVKSKKKRIEKQLNSKP